MTNTMNTMENTTAIISKEELQVKIEAKKAEIAKMEAEIAEMEATLSTMKQQESIKINADYIYDIVDELEITKEYNEKVYYKALDLLLKLVNATVRKEDSSTIVERLNSTLKYIFNNTEKQLAESVIIKAGYSMVEGVYSFSYKDNIYTI